MKHVLNFGSLNFDHVYQVEHFVQPGETLPCSEYQRFAGGKGFNQSIALARSGRRVIHAGQIGTMTIADDRSLITRAYSALVDQQKR